MADNRSCYRAYHCLRTGHDPQGARRGGRDLRPRLFAVGAAVFGIQTIGKLGVAVAFGFVLLALALRDPAAPAALLKLMVSGFGGATDETGALGTNEYGKTVSPGGAMVVRSS